MEEAQAPTDDGEISHHEVDGKATPTATETNSRNVVETSLETARLWCARHRGQSKRACRGKKENVANPGNKSKHGRSITLVVMYT